MISNHFFTQLPPPSTALFVFSTLCSLVAGNVLPQETKTIEARAFNVRPWPLATLAPASPLELLRRESNTICGYIGGDPNLPATCLAGSHCAADVENGVIGCCPDKGPCNAGIFTGCVDRNSGPQTVADPYIYTCRGKNVCYKNMFEGGYFQYGCGSASPLATTVVLTASGRLPLDLTTISVKLTATVTPLSSPATLSSEPSRTSDSSTVLESPVASGKPPEPSETHGGAAPSSNGSSSTNTGAIIGGAVGGVAAVFAIATLAFLLWRRKSSNVRRGPGNEKDNRYIRSMAPAAHREFEPLPSSHDASEARFHAGYGNSTPGNSTPGNRTPGISTLAASTSDSVSAVSGRSGSPRVQPYSHDTIDAVATRSGHTNYDSDRVPLTRELDDFSHGFNSALEAIESDSDVEANRNHMATYPGPRRGGGGGVLWQQNRRRSRNLAWM
ncbi:hypothetical protein X797_005073 [Metarhizium robertsii]|uniref:Uncharacterized protein n=2 Tax=Metarhizium robertsii TaxID=568076 RepID=E9F291_METRA|nr:uncharacterized protein MAA_06289 [Metarhizium robertsii ARSEF 23]EFY98180.1 hypothetical protein MAA_06289 [Metarhizium robertsii ARSEF 23]EXV01557.1 hypothetical protein X797_005073 [Metarhizium robertsii]